MQKSGNELSLDLHKSRNELSLDLHKSGTKLSLNMHKSGNELSLDVHKSSMNLFRLAQGVVMNLDWVTTLTSHQSGILHALILLFC